MSTSSVPAPWRVTDAAFVEIEIRRPSDRQLRVDFGGGLRSVITESGQGPLSASLIETLLRFDT